MTESFRSQAVFLSYASEDAVAAARIAEALRSGGIDVWFDRDELRGGDAWDRRIRTQIGECRHFLPVISAATEARAEGYFRREWKLAVDRTHDLSERVAFLVPVVIDTIAEGTADVPDAFRAVQWTRLPNGVTGQAFVDRIRSLLNPKHPSVPDAAPEVVPTVRRSTRPGTGPRLAPVAVLLLLATIAGVYFTRHESRPASAAGMREAPAPAAEVAPAIPEKSVAVLPFVDLSEHRDQEYFSDGMAEEVIDLLVKIPGLKVPARSSSFYFKGKPAKIQEIARELGVANVLEGTVRKQGDHLRVTAQLVQARTGYSLWSETYDRQLHDVFRTQDEIAAAVVKELKVSLLAPAGAFAAPTRNDEAYELYLQARALTATVATPNMAKAYRNLKRAVALDPDFALAWADIAQIVSNDGWDLTSIYSTGDQRLLFEQWTRIWAAARAEARAASDRAVQLAPNAAEAHFARALVLDRLDWDWAGSEGELARARALAPDDPRILLAIGELAINLGRFDEGMGLARRAELLDPLGKARKLIARASAAVGDLETAESAARRVVELYPTEEDAHFNLGCILLDRGNAAAALEVFRKAPTTAPYSVVGPPLALDALGRRGEAEAAMHEVEGRFGVDMAYQIAYFYARRGEPDRALDWLERAVRQHDGGLARVKVDPMLRSLRGTPRFEALLRKLQFAPSAAAVGAVPPGEPSGRAPGG